MRNNRFLHGDQGKFLNGRPQTLTRDPFAVANVLAIFYLLLAIIPRYHALFSLLTMSVIQAEGNAANRTSWLAKTT